MPYDPGKGKFHPDNLRVGTMAPDGEPPMAVRLDWFEVWDAITENGDDCMQAMMPDAVIRWAQEKPCNQAFIDYLRLEALEDPSGLKVMRMIDRLEAAVNTHSYKQWMLAMKNS